MNLEKAFELVSEIISHSGKEEFSVKGINVSNLIIQSLFEYLTGDRKAFLRKYRRISFLSSLIKGTLHVFNIRKYDILAFGTSGNRRYFKGKMFNIFLDWLFLPEIGLDTSKIGFVESITPSVPYHFKNSYSKNLIYEEPIILKILIKSMILREKIKDDVKKIVKTLNFPGTFNKEDFFENLLNQISRYIASVEVYEKILSESRVKYIFMINYYSTIRRAIVRVAKEMGIKVIEVQHGIISPYHLAYVQRNPINFDDIPDYLLLFGDFYKDVILKNSKLFEENQLFVVGNYYIETVRNSPPNLPKDLMNIINKVKKPILLLTSQSMFPVDVYKPYIKSLISTEEYYLIIKNHPGDLPDKFREFENTKGVIVISDPSISLYELLKITDVHITIHSTSAID